MRLFLLNVTTNVGDIKLSSNESGAIRMGC